MLIASLFLIALTAGGTAGLFKFVYELYANQYLANQTYTLAVLSLKDNLNKYIFLYLIVLAGLFLLSFITKKLFFRKFKINFTVLLISFVPVTACVVWLYADYTIFTITFPQALNFIFFNELNPGDSKFLLRNLKLVYFVFLSCSIMVPVIYKSVNKLDFKSNAIRLLKKVLSLTALVFFMLCLSSNLTVFAKRNNNQGPNIVLIVIDTLRARNLSCYGYSKKTSPFIDSLSEKSLVFDNHYAACSWTSPSCASIYTSFYPFQHGVVTGIHARLKILKKYPGIKHNSIPKEITTLPEYLKNHGYRTYGVSANLHICKAEGFDQGYDVFMPSYEYQNAEQMNKKIFSLEKKLKKSGKYFLYLHYMDPHQPYNQRKPWFEDQGTKHKNMINAYDSEISYVDHHLRELFDKFGWDKNTLVIITSDHGESFMEHGQAVGHGISLFNEEIHVPLLVYLPDKKVHKRIKKNVSGVDIFPTITDAVKLSEPDVREGLSLLNLLNEDYQEGDERAVYSYLKKKRRQGDILREFVYKAVFYKSFKYLNTGKFHRLFDLINDPGEKKNLAKKDTRTLNLLMRKLKDFEQTCVKFVQVEQTNVLTDKQHRDLKSLGYVQ